MKVYVLLKSPNSIQGVYSSKANAWKGIELMAGKKPLFDMGQGAKECALGEYAFSVHLKSRGQLTFKVDEYPDRWFMVTEEDVNTMMEHNK